MYGTAVAPASAVPGVVVLKYLLAQAHTQANKCFVRDAIIFHLVYVVLQVKGTIDNALG